MDGTGGSRGETGKRRGKRWCQRDLGGWKTRMDPEGRECKILQPRGTHGDVISTTESRRHITILTILQPRNHSVSMYEWPILLGLSLGKSLSISITALPLVYPPFLYIPYPRVPLASPRLLLTTGITLTFAHLLSPTFQPIRTDSRDKDFIFRQRCDNQDSGRRNCAAEETERNLQCFLRCRFLSLWLLIIHYADSVILSLAF